MTFIYSLTYSNISYFGERRKIYNNPPSLPQLYNNQDISIKKGIMKEIAELKADTSNSLNTLKDGFSDLKLNKDEVIAILEASKDVKYSDIYLKQGNENHKYFHLHTLVLQSALKELDFYNKSLDGLYGRGTVKAIREFQKENNIGIDGWAGTATKTALLNALKFPTTATPATPATPAAKEILIKKNNLTFDPEITKQKFKKLEIEQIKKITGGKITDVNIEKGEVYGTGLKVKEFPNTTFKNIDFDKDGNIIYLRVDEGQNFQKDKLNNFLKSKNLKLPDNVEINNVRRINLMNNKYYDNSNDDWKPFEKTTTPAIKEKFSSKPTLDSKSVKQYFKKLSKKKQEKITGGTITKGDVDNGAPPVSEKIAPIPSLASDIPEGADTEIRDNWIHIQLSSVENPFTTPSGRQYVKTENGVFYNSKPEEKNTWGKINESNTMYFKVGEQILLANGVGRYITSFRAGEDAPRRYFQFQVNGHLEKLFDAQGNEIPKKGDLWEKTGEDGTKYYYTAENGEIVSCDTTGKTETALRGEILTSLQSVNKNIKYSQASNYFIAPYYKYVLSINNKNYEVFDGGKVLSGETFTLEVLGENGYEKLDKKQFLQKVSERIPQVQKAAELLQALENVDAAGKKKTQYMKQLQELYRIETEHNLRLVDVTELLNHIVWNIVETNGNTESVLEFVIKLEKTNTEFNEWDTLMRYYQMRRDTKKAKEYAQKIVKFDDSQVSQKLQNEVQKNKKKAQEILSEL